MQLKNYQTRTLEIVRSYLEQLAEMKAKVEKVKDPDLEFDFAVKA
jgi:hypothetical protein